MWFRNKVRVHCCSHLIIFISLFDIPVSVASFGTMMLDVRKSKALISLSLFFYVFHTTILYSGPVRHTSVFLD